MQKLWDKYIEHIKESLGDLTRASSASATEPFQKHICKWLTHSKILGKNNQAQLSSYAHLDSGGTGRDYE